MNIGFIGLGKLGLPCALAIESRGHNVVGYDPSEQVKDIVDTKKLQYQEIWAQEHLEKSKIEIKPSMIQPIKEIKSLGKFIVKISLHSEVDAEITINVETAETIQ